MPVLGWPGSKPTRSPPKRRRRCATTTAPRRWEPRPFTSSILFRRRNQHQPLQSEQHKVPSPMSPKRNVRGNSFNPSGTYTYIHTCVPALCFVNVYVLCTTFYYYDALITTIFVFWFEARRWRRWRGRQGLRWWKETLPARQSLRWRTLITTSTPITMSLLHLMSVTVRLSSPTSSTTSPLLVIDQHYNIMIILKTLS